MIRGFTSLFCLLFASTLWAEVLVLDGRDVIPVPKNLPTALDKRPSVIKAEKRLNDSYDPSLYSESIKPNSNVYWYRLDLRSEFTQPDAQTRFLVLENHIIRHLTFFVFQSGKLLKQKQVGLNDEHNPAAQENPPPFKGSYIDFEIQNNQDITILIRKKNDGPGILPLSIYSEAGFEEWHKDRHLFWGAVMGILIAMALYNIIVFSLHPSKAYLWYLAFHTTTFLYFGGLNAYGYLLWPFAFQSWLAQNIMFLNYVLVFLIIQFSSQFLEIKTYAKWHKKFVTPLCTLAVIGAIISLFTEETTMIPYFLVVQLIGTTYGISMGWVALRNGLKAAKFFLLSWVFTLSGGAIGMGTAIGELPVTLLTIHGFLFGTLIELFLFSVALAFRMKDMEMQFLTRSFYYPDTQAANFSYIKNELPKHLPGITKKHHNIAILIFDIKGYRELVSLYGPDALALHYQLQTERMTAFIKKQNWAVAMPLPTGDQVYIAALPGEQIFLMVDTPSINDSDAFKPIVDDILRHFDQIQDSLDEKIKIQFNVGISHLGNDATINSAFKESQVALLSCLESNSQYQYYEPSQSDAIAQRSELIIELDKAIKAESMTLYIQPQYSLTNQKIISGEILLRWFHPTKGEISPARFIGLAEQSGLIFSITKFIIKESCIWLKQLKESKPNIYNQFQLSLNISALDIAEPQFIPYLQSTLFFYGIDNQRIMLEVTESAVLNNSDLFIETIHKLHTLGFAISIDDFGTGYSSMQYLQTMKADEIKIDMTFIRDINSNQVNQDITRAIIQLAKATNSQTVAEGIETPEELQTLKQLACEYGQGYFWTRPQPLSDFIEHFLS